MKEKLQKFIELWDIPSGAILGLWSVVMLGMCVAAFVRTAQGVPTDIPTNVRDLFNWVLTAFAASKSLRTMFGKVVQ
jgi:hypothetical protein